MRNFFERWNSILFFGIIAITLFFCAVVQPNWFTIFVAVAAFIIMGIILYQLGYKTRKEEEGAIKVVHTIKPHTRIITITEKDDDEILISEETYTYDRRYYDVFRHVINR